MPLEIDTTFRTQALLSLTLVNSQTSARSVYRAIMLFWRRLDRREAGAARQGHVRRLGVELVAERQAVQGLLVRFRGQADLFLLVPRERAGILEQIVQPPVEVQGADAVVRAGHLGLGHRADGVREHRKVSAAARTLGLRPVIGQPAGLRVVVVESDLLQQPAAVGGEQHPARAAGETGQADVIAVAAPEPRHVVHGQQAPVGGLCAGCRCGRTASSPRARNAETCISVSSPAWSLSSWSRKDWANLAMLLRTFIVAPLDLPASPAVHAAVREDVPSRVGRGDHAGGIVPVAAGRVDVAAEVVVDVIQRQRGGQDRCSSRTRSTPPGLRIPVWKAAPDSAEGPQRAVMVVVSVGPPALRPAAQQGHGGQARLAARASG